MTDVTQILNAIEQGDPSAAEQLMPWTLVGGDACVERTTSSTSNEHVVRELR